MPEKQTRRKVEDIQAEIDALHPQVVAALAAHNISDRAADLIIKINGHNSREYASRAIELQNLQRELVQAQARDAARRI